MSLKILRLEKGVYEVQVDVDFYDPEGAFQKSAKLSKVEILEALDSFFRQITASKGFPIQFPFFCSEGHDEKQTEKTNALVDEIFEALPKELQKDDELYLTINAICSSAMETLDPETQEEADAYRKMFETHVLPEGYH